MFQRVLIPIMSACLFTATACRKDAAVKPAPVDSIGQINQWVLDSLHRYYYWADQMPDDVEYSQSTDRFFNALLSSNDRFSWISNEQDLLPPSNSYFNYGFHYALLETSGYPGLIGVITLVNHGSAAEQAGLKRGTCFSQVNGTTITMQNKKAIIGQLSSGSSLQLTMGILSADGWHQLENLTIQKSFAAENPVHYTRTYTAAGITTGYIFYNAFDENYDDLLIHAIRKLKQAGSSELILDLRYNSGGSVASSAKLAALLARNLKADETYSVYQGNRQEGRKIRSLQAVLNTSANSIGKDYAALQAEQLTLQRVFVLTTPATVSAAELIINNIRPFINVIQIGQTTAGKDEAGFLIEDLRMPKQVFWKMQPTVYKLFNKNNEGNYAQGLSPQYVVEELSSLPLAGIGEVNDPLVRRALQLIYGNDIPGGYIILRQAPIKVNAVYRSTLVPGQPVLVK